MATTTIRLNQVVTLVNGKKGPASEKLKRTRDILKTPKIFDAQTRKYTPRDAENGEKFPDEDRPWQKNVRVEIAEVVEEWKNLLDLKLTLDTGNSKAFADVVVGGEVLVEEVPAVTLITLEENLVQIRKMIEDIPTPDPAEIWEFDSSQDCLVSKPTTQAKMAKVPEVQTLAEATKEHPAQAMLIHVDKPIGDWLIINRTTKIPVAQKKQALRRLDEVLDAVKEARNEANSGLTEKKGMGKILDFIFEDIV